MGGYVQDFIAGLHYLLVGLRLITAPRIRAYVVVPLIINSLLFAGGLLYGAHLWGRLLDTTLPSWLEWLEWLLWPLFVVLALGVVFFCFSLVANLIAAPFNSNLAKAVEIRLTGQTREHNGGLRKLPAELIGAWQWSAAFAPSGEQLPARPDSAIIVYSFASDGSGSFEPGDGPFFAVYRFDDQ